MYTFMYIYICIHICNTYIYIYIYIYICMYNEYAKLTNNKILIFTSSSSLVLLLHFKKWLEDANSWTCTWNTNTNTKWTLEHEEYLSKAKVRLVFSLCLRCFWLTGTLYWQVLYLLYKSILFAFKFQFRQLELVTKKFCWNRQHRCMIGRIWCSVSKTKILQTSFFWFHIFNVIQYKEFV